MNASAASSRPATALEPRRLRDRSLAVQLLAVLAGTAFLTLSSRLEVPMYPVPMTMQTFAVTLIGALYGARLGTLTIVAWLLEAAVGLPVLAGGAGGLAPFAGTTAGYLFAFPLAAGLVGLCADRGWTRGPARAFAAMLAGNALCLLLGGAWLAALIGLPKAWALGVTPFVLGGVLKSALGAATLSLWRRARPATGRV